MNTPCITIGTSAIRATPEGLYSLNDLHRASGGEQKHEPNYFMRLDSTQALIEEMSKSPEMGICTKTQRGAHGGTFVCKELVIAYAAWISPAFHLKVIRVFLEQHQPQPGQQFFNGRRWLITFRDGREVVQEVDWDACLIKFEDLPKVLKEQGNLMDQDLLARIGQTCIEKLRTKATARSTPQALPAPRRAA